LDRPASSFVKVTSLRKSFGSYVAIDDVSLDVAKASTLALLGPSGCGKTTMLRCIAGLEMPDAGSIEIAGRVVFDSSRGINLMPEERGLGIVFQSYAVWPHMTVAENVAFPLKVRGIAKAEQRKRAQRILEVVGLGAWHDRSATALSGGQQQRVALARALIHEPSLVLFDEALSNLDAQLREQMRMELKILQDRLGFTAIYVTHDQQEAFGLAENLVLMNRGRVEATGHPREIFRLPPSAFAARFLGLNQMEAKVLRTTEHARVSGVPPVRYAEVELENGQTLWGLIGQSRAPEIGEAVLMCMRREHIAVVPVTTEQAHMHEAIPTRQDHAVTITATSFLGLDEEYALDFGGVELRVVQRASALKAGDSATARFTTDECIILPRDTVDVTAAASNIT
jgi:ABC-type Fe3+/spermidine/putrescine transport system ATPase subunit